MSFPLSVLVSISGLALLVTAGCSSDSESSGNDDAPKVCVKVQQYTADNQRDGEPSDCLVYPAECAGAAKACGDGTDSCSQALNALCKEGTERTTCVGTSLNDVVQKVDLTCQAPKPLD